MKTSKLWINSTVRRNDEVNDILRDFAAEAGIAGRDYQHMCLLTEETLGMAHDSLKNFDGEIWLEKTAGGYEIILEADVRESEEAGSALPASVPGFMAKIAGMLNCSYMFENTEEMPENLAALLPDYMSYGAPVRGDAPVWAGQWSLSAYRQNLQERRKKDPASEAGLEELEKSIVASLADEVNIGIHGQKIRLVISRAVRKEPAAGGNR